MALVLYPFSQSVPFVWSIYLIYIFHLRSLLIILVPVAIFLIDEDLFLLVFLRSFVLRWLSSVWCLSCRLLCCSYVCYRLWFAVPVRFGFFLVSTLACGRLAVARGDFRCGAQAQSPCGMWDPSSPRRGQTRGPCTARPILNHWTTRKSLLRFCSSGLYARLC